MGEVNDDILVHPVRLSKLKLLGDFPRPHPIKVIFKSHGTALNGGFKLDIE